MRVVLRFFTVIAFAALVTSTTRSSAMLDAIEFALRPLRLFGVNTHKISLAFSLAIRFAPMIAAMAEEVREAQRVRGLERSVFAIAVPTVVRTLKLADDIDADLIMIPSHSPTMSDYLLGSTAASVMRHAKCAVLAHRLVEELGRQTARLTRLVEAEAQDVGKVDEQINERD